MLRVVTGTTVLSALALSLLTLGTAHAEATRPSFEVQWVGPDEAKIVEPQHVESNIIFLNRCANGCTVNRGYNDSRTNTSTIPNRSTANIAAWQHSDADWAEMVQCVQALYDPYGVVITDKDPGPNVQHFEAIVAGDPSDVGMSAGVGGVSPAGCGIIENAITFTFANVGWLGGDPGRICEVVGQETAHAFGLDHEFLCSDPMTYLEGCGTKWFQDINAECGEYEARGCYCGAPTQNSHKALTSFFGVGENPGPNLRVARPGPNTNVQPGFVIEITDDNYYYGVDDIEVFVNGQSVGVGSSAPYIFNAPADVSGYVTIEARGKDARGFEGSTVAEVHIGEDCKKGSCGDGRVCYKGYCVADETNEGGFGATCDTNESCDGQICAADSEGLRTCTATCEKNSECPTGHSCTSAGDTKVCWPSSNTGGCGCNSANPSGGAAGLLLLALGWLYRRRRSF